MSFQKPAIILVLALALGVVLVAALGLMSGARPGTAGDLEPDLTGRRIAFLVADGVEAAGVNAGADYLSERGASVTVLSLSAGRVMGDRSFTRADRAVVDATVDDFDCLIIPGGTHYKVLSQSSAALDFISEFHTTGKLTAGMCGGVYVLVETTAVAGCRLAFVSGLDTARIAAAGAIGGAQEDLYVLSGNLFTASSRANTALFIKKTAAYLAASEG